jgi:hypothetical protein
MDTNSTNKTYLLMQKATIIVILGLILFLTISALATVGLCCKIDKEEKTFQQKMQEYDAAAAEREAVREAEIAEVKRELSQSFYAPAIILNKPEEEMEENNEPEIEIEPQIGEPLFVMREEISEDLEETKEVETKLVETEPEVETKAEVAEDETQSEVAETTETEVEEIEEAQPSEPSIEVTEVETPSYTVGTQSQTWQQEIVHSNSNEILQNFLNANGMTLNDFIIRMTCMVYPEAQGEAFIGKQGVAEVAINWIYSGLKTDWWDISSGFANIPVQRYYELKYSILESDRIAIEECRQAVETVIDGAHPVEDMLGVKPYYFLLPEKSDPINVYVMLQATYQLWVGNQLYLGMEGIDWTQKTN